MSAKDHAPKHQIPDNVRDLAKKIVADAQRDLLAFSSAGSGTTVKLQITLPSHARLTVATDPHIDDWCADPNPSDSVYPC